MNYLDKYKVLELTPVDNIGGMYFKRDDLYMPFEDIPLSGGKVRQAISLIGNNYEYIKNECDGNIYTGTSVTSPQGIIVSRVAKDFGFNSVLFVGNTNPNGILRNPLLVQALEQGCKINYDSVLAYENVLNATIRKQKEKGNKFFQVKFGINLESDPEAIVDSVAYQVQNIPDDLDYLIIPGGSCITTGGILKGIVKYNKHPKKVVCIQISGFDRSETVNKIMGDDTYPYEMRISKDYPYSKHINIKLSNGLKLDPLYEAKAFDYMVKYMGDEIQGKKVLFWIVGDSNFVRDKKVPYKVKK